MHSRSNRKKCLRERALSQRPDARTWLLCKERNQRYSQFEFQREREHHYAFNSFKRVSQFRKRWCVINKLLYVCKSLLSCYTNILLAIKQKLLQQIILTHQPKNFVKFNKTTETEKKIKYDIGLKLVLSMVFHNVFCIFQIYLNVKWNVKTLRQKVISHCLWTVKYVWN